MSVQEFNVLLGLVAKAIAGRELDDALAEHLNATFPAHEKAFQRLTELCAIGEHEGWLLTREDGDTRLGRAKTPGNQAGNFSFDVVRMKDIRGPHHIRTNGEIGAILPISGEPKFDGLSKGWYVYPPGSDHHPTVSGGDAYILYVWPDGANKVTGR